MRGNIIIMIIAILVTGLFIYYYKYYSWDVDNFTDVNKITFLSDKYTKSFLREDSDGYVKRMSQADLTARKVNSSSEYIDKITKCNINDVFLESKDRILLTECAIKADNFLMSYVYKDGIPGKDIADIPWKFAIICEEYEEGLPHTRQDIIFLSKRSIKTDADYLTSLLIHEKTHIFQRLNEIRMDHFLASKGYVVLQSKPEHKLRRSNPDINSKVYFDTHTQRELIFLYNSDRPSGINDVDNSNHTIEHPYEQMAYDIANDYLRGYLQNVLKPLHNNI